MKNTMIGMIVLAMMLAFVPRASAADSAVLGLSVTFSVDQDLIRVNEISDELDHLAEKAGYVYRTALDSGIPEEIKVAIDQLKSYVDYINQELIAELEEILVRRPDLKDLINEVLQKGSDLRQEITVAYIGDLEGALFVFEFVEAMANSPLDPNRDGRIDVDDVDTIYRGYSYALKFSHLLTDEARVILDRNGDGMLDSRDINAAIADIDEAMTQIEKVQLFAYMLATNAFDFNGDGMLSPEDVYYVNDMYELAIGYLNRYLDNETLDILDANFDGVVDQLDSDLVYHRVKMVVTVSEFVAILAKGSLDFNRDGVVDANDMLHVSMNYELAFEVLEYLGDGALRVLDQNGDSEVNASDIGAVLARFDLVQAVTAFATLIRDGRFDLNHDGVIDERDVESARWHYEIAYRELVNLDDETRDILDQNKDGRIDDYDLHIVIEKIMDAMQRISIELLPPDWSLQGVGLGELRSNMDETGMPIHVIINTGNVDVLVDIGYGPQPDVYPAIRPGLEQGLDTFITAVGRSADGLLNIIPPNERRKVAVVGVDTKHPLELTYGAPTAVSAGIKEHRNMYELRAYSAVYILEQ